ncbi:protein NDRG3 isoform X3 [Tribolium castaneum]|uniref:protein NDRG3 isoform X3 n=1 Tax=Tribolium castaneum TaxID=7070 RepID=UPI00077D9E2F|nr:PREDICTED: protein NDRG3 isoform X4 [Tribolium castaneum]|eukprot:XP_015834237.1 PREDICTED: protein NDRG3 isoform X4 [Tribolium castaneum]
MKELNARDLLEDVYQTANMLKSHKPQGNPNALKNSTTDQTTFALYRTVLFRDRYVGHVNMAFDATDCTMPSDSMDDIELKNIQLQFPSTRSLSRDDSSAQEEVVETDRGNLVVAVQGSRNKPAILTYHDLGLNYVSSFQAFFNYIDMRALLENFCVYHVNAPGQEEGSATLPEDYIYPTMDELAGQLGYVLSHFGLKQFIGFGVGAGANILARFALNNPNQVTALCLINCVSTQAGWIEWGYQKLNARHLRSKGMTQGVLDYLMWHHFGRNTEERNHDLVQVYKSYFERNVNPTNLALFIDSYVRRTDLNIQRELDPTKRKESTTLKMPVMNITGSLSPHVDDTVTFNGRLDPTNSSWMKISDCGMVLEEQPGKVAEAFRLFLQGEGYVAPLSPTKMALFRKTSLEELLKSKMPNGGQWPMNVIHITENPISAVVC